jgi:hypothetical protein
MISFFISELFLFSEFDSSGRFAILEIKFLSSRKAHISVATNKIKNTINDMIGKISIPSMLLKCSDNIISPVD